MQGSGASKLFRTGDLARYLADGTVECLGRIDHQIKLRGFRIELGEIESGLVSYSGIRQAVVVVREDVPGDKRLAAYFVCDGEAPGTGDLRTHLKSTMPDYMVPTAFMKLDALPLTPNGKIDRKALPVPDDARIDLESNYVAPEGANQESLAAIWAEVLGLEKVGVQDNFFDLGGHSLMVIKVLSRIREELGTEIPVSTMFQNPTIHDLAEAMVASQIGQTDDDELRRMLEELEGS